MIEMDFSKYSFEDLIDLNSRIVDYVKEQRDHRADRWQVRAA